MFVPPSAFMPELPLVDGLWGAGGPRALRTYFT